MTTAYDGALLWCAVQALVIASLGLLAAWIVARRAPAAGARVAAAAVATIIAVTLLAPAPMPAFSIGAAPERQPPTPAARQDSSASASSALSGTANQWAGYAAKLKAALTKYLAAADADQAPEQHSGFSARRVVVAVLLAAALVGICRFAAAAALVVKLRRGGRPIADDGLQRAFAELKAALNVQRRVELCESPGIAGPALVGWRRPVVLLPVDRSGWTDDQVRATLAHELAHVARGDFFWRAVARFTVAIHFYQPAVHWLARRLALLQEVGADQLAAQAVGGPAAYVRSLSQLAIRLDDHTRRRPAPLVLPALSSNLTRRIIMLRSKEGSNAIERRRIGGFLAAALIALVGAGTMALRGAAETPAVTPAAEGARAFDAPPVDWSFMGPAEEGLIVVRPHRMTQRAGLAPLARFIQGAMDSTAAEAKTPSAWRPRLEMIDYYAIRMNIPAQMFNAEGEIEPETAEQGRTITGDLAIRFHDEKAANDFWAQTEVTPDAEVVTDNSFIYVRLPVEAIGFMYTAKRDALTYVLSDDLDRLRSMVEHIPTASDGESAPPWKSLDGGLIMAYGGKNSTTLGVQILTSMLPMLRTFDVEMSVALTLLHNDVQLLGFGIDVDPATDEIKLQLEAKCNDAAAAQRLVGSFANLQGFAIEQVVGIVQGLRDPARVKSLTEEDRATVDAHLCWTRLVADARVETQPANDGSATVTIESAARLPQAFITAYLPDASSNESTK